MREIKGGASLRQIERPRSVDASILSRTFRTTFAAERTRAGFEWARFGIILVTKESSTSFTVMVSAMKSRMYTLPHSEHSGRAVSSWFIN